MSTLIYSTVTSMRKYVTNVESVKQVPSNCKLQAAMFQCKKLINPDRSVSIPTTHVLIGRAVNETYTTVAHH